MKKLIIILITITIITAVLFILYNNTSKDQLLELKFDLINSNNAVETKSEIDSIIESFQEIKFQDLNKEYLTYTKSNETNYKKRLKGKLYKIIYQDDFNKRIVGNYRIKDFVCKDSLYYRCLFDKKKAFYWLIDTRLLYAVLNLQNSLKDKGYNNDAFWIRYGHRNPKLNEDVGGAKFSTHLFGQAIDMFIRDINNDGKYTLEDKEIVLEIADKEVIKNKGGIGRYPGSRIVHIDVRGHRSRWDSY